MQEKKDLRKKARDIRKSLDVKGISEKITENILRLEEYQNARNIMLFYPLEHEVNLLGLLANSSKNFFLPRVQGDKMDVCPYRIGDKLILSKFKTQEPVTVPVSPDILDIIFVPALMVDEHLHRLGYGGGFYDKFLSKHAKTATKIVAIPCALMVSKLPSESFDAKIDIVITEIK